MKIRYFVTMRRQWPYWNWVIWERWPGAETAIVDEGLTFRRSTAYARAERRVEQLRSEVPQ